MITAPLTDEQYALLSSLAGHKIISVNYINEDEGTYCLLLDDGRQATFTAVGDDMTWTKFEVQE